MNIHPASSVWSGKPIEVAVHALIAEEAFDPLLGKLDTRIIQLCPQHPSTYTEELLARLAAAHPGVQFLLHADVRTKEKAKSTLELSDFDGSEKTTEYFKSLAALSRQLAAPHYSLHAGKRTCSLERLKEKHSALQEIFEEIPVVIEGLYPFRGTTYLVDTWSEYEWLMKQNGPYAIDLSHTNIVEKHVGKNDALLRDLLAHGLCREIHLSFNEGNVDNHEVGSEKHAALWERYQWLLEGRNPSALLFSEGNLSLHERKKTNVNANSV